MKLSALRLAACLLAAPTAVFAWDGRVCNESAQEVEVKFHVAAANPFTIKQGPHSDSAPRSVAGLCFEDNVDVFDMSVDPPRYVGISGSGWGRCTNIVVFISGDTPDNMRAHYVRTQVSVSCTR